MIPQEQGVYMLVFCDQQGNPKPFRHARYYIGFALDLKRRIAEHQAQQGAVITRRAMEAGWTVKPVCLWPGQTRDFERTLKKYRKPSAFSPLDNPQYSGKYKPQIILI